MKTEEKLDRIQEGISTISAHLAVISDKVESLGKDMWGNGRPGVKAEVQTNPHDIHEVKGSLDNIKESLKEQRSDKHFWIAQSIAILMAITAIATVIMG